MDTMHPVMRQALAPILPPGFRSAPAVATVDALHAQITELNQQVAELKELYDKILADDEMVEWLNDTMLLEVDTMTEDDVKAHIENVKSIVEQYKDIVAG